MSKGQLLIIWVGLKTVHLKFDGYSSFAPLDGHSEAILHFQTRPNTFKVLWIWHHPKSPREICPQGPTEPYWERNQFVKLSEIQLLLPWQVLRWEGGGTLEKKCMFWVIRGNFIRTSYVDLDILGYWCSVYLSRWPISWCLVGTWGNDL